MWGLALIARGERDDAVDCVNLGMGEFIYAMARIVCVCVPCVFHYVHSGTYLGLFDGGDTESGFCFAWSFISFLVFQEERRRDREDIGAT
jgi:hypothetical protein